MKLGVNGWRLHGHTGVPRYIANIVKQWTPDVVGDRFDQINVYLPKPLDPSHVAIPDNVEQKVLRPDCRMLVWENLRFGPFADEDVLFCPSYTRPLISRGRVVVTTHDALPPLYPHLFSWKNRVFYNPLYGWSARNASMVITVSKAAQKDISKCWGVPPSRIRVIYEAAAKVFRPETDRGKVEKCHKRVLGTLDPFFLFVGKLSGRRSMPVLFESFSEFKNRTAHPHKLVIIGTNLHNLPISEMLSRLGITEHVVYPGYVGDEDLNKLYNAADALVSPCEYETMSLPAMEAQATGTPVIAIDVEALREITGGAALLIPQLNVNELFRAMSQIAADESQRHELAQRGLEFSARFSWKRCAQETLEALEEVGRLG